MELDELIHSIDIVEYIGQYVELQERGEEWWGLSCFKEENTPSFSVRKDPPVFYDYSSGAGGGLFEFVKMYHKCSNSQAVKIIQEYAGVDDITMQKYRKLEATVDCKKFKPIHKEMKQSNIAKIDNNYMDLFEKREDKLQIWIDEGISTETLERFCVRYDPFSDRLVYPIKDVKGNIVNVGGRTLDSNWKEKGLRKYTYFYKWGSMDVIYGLYDNMKNIIERREVIIFEGCKSVLIADSFGVKNTAALLTSHMNPQQLKILVSLGCRVVFALDKDVNIRKDKNIMRLKDYVNVDYICDMRDLLNEKDSPVDKGFEVFNTLYKERFRYR